MIVQTDKTTTIETLSEIVAAFSKARGWNPSDRSTAISISIEAAELLEHFQWDESQGRENAQDIQDELADVLIYCLRFATSRGIDVSTAITSKMDKNAIKYPIGADYFERKTRARATVA